MSSISNPSNSIPKVFTTEDTASVSIQRYFKGFSQRKQQKKLFNAAVSIQCNFRGFFQRKQLEHIKLIQSTWSSFWSSFTKAQDEEVLVSCIGQFAEVPVFQHFKDSNAYRLMKVLIKSNQSRINEMFTRKHLETMLDCRGFDSTFFEQKIGIIVEFFLSVPLALETKNLLLERLPVGTEKEIDSIQSDEIKLLYYIILKVKTLKEEDYVPFSSENGFSTPPKPPAEPLRAYSPLDVFPSPPEARMPPITRKSLTCVFSMNYHLFFVLVNRVMKESLELIWIILINNCYILSLMCLHKIFLK